MSRKFISRQSRLAKKNTGEGNLVSGNGVRAIIFDLDGTLRHNDPSSTEAFFDYAVQLGAADSAGRRKSATRWTHYYWAQSPEMLADLDHFQTLSPEFWVYYSERALIQFGCAPAQAKFLAPTVHQRMVEEYKPRDLVLEGVPQVLGALKSAGFRLGVVSNRDDAFDEYLVMLNLHEHFDLTLAAGEINAWKPEPEIFEYALQQLNVSAEQAIYVGDNYFADIVGARDAGLRPGCLVIKQFSELLTLLEK